VVAQIDKTQTAVITSPMYPPGKGYRFTDVFCA
jgi:hypothetical protein